MRVVILSFLAAIAQAQVTSVSLATTRYNDKNLLVTDTRVIGTREANVRHVIGRSSEGGFEIVLGGTKSLGLPPTCGATADWQIRAWTNDGSVTETTGSLTGLTWPTGAMQPYAVVINRNATANHSFRMHSGVIEWQQ